MNRTILMGRLSRDPEMRVTPNGVPVATFTLVLNRKQEQEEQTKTDFINCVAWRDTAKLVARGFGRGDRMLLEGRIQTRSYNDTSGVRRYVTEVVAEAVTVVECRRTASERDGD